jgi:hypothetical protein
MMLSIAMLSSCLSTIATADPKEVQIHLSELELQEIFKNPTRSYIYVGEEVSDLASLMVEIGKLDANPESLVHGLRNHIQKGFNVANYDSVAQALEYAEEVLRDKGGALAEDKRADLTRKLNLIIDQVIDEQLNLDAEILSFMKDSVDVTADVTRQGLRLLVIPNKLDVQGRARFRKKVLFKDDVKFEEHAKFEHFVSFHGNVKFRQDVTIDGTLSVMDGIIVDGSTLGCDITVGCNLNMNSSVDSTIGNVFKGGLPFIHTFGPRNTFVGEQAGNFVMTGNANNGFGFFALNANTAGTLNVAVGSRALSMNTTGSANTAVGSNALRDNTTGQQNTAFGSDALPVNTTGIQNTAIGQFALTANTFGDGNTAVGKNALSANTTGFLNTAVGHTALTSNATGVQNVAVGHGALANHLADSTVAMGVNALSSNTTGAANTAIGHFALSPNVTGSGNTALGHLALANSSNGNNNIGIGNLAGITLTTGSGNVYIGADAGAAAESTTIRIGAGQVATFIAGIRGATTGINNAIAVLIDSAGQLGTISSSIHVKDQVMDMDDDSSKILDLNPVTFVYKSDASAIKQYGLIAEEVEKVSPDLVVRDKEGKSYSVRYDQVNAMLLNEFLKEHKTVQELKNEIAELTATVKEQAAQIQKVSARLDVSERRSRTVLNDPQNDRRR